MSPACSYVAPYSIPVNDESWSLAVRPPGYNRENTRNIGNYEEYHRRATVSLKSQSGYVPNSDQCVVPRAIKIDIDGRGCEEGSVLSMAVR